VFKKVISDNDIRHGSSVFSTDQRGNSEIIPANVSFNGIHNSGVIGERMKLSWYYTGDQTGDEDASYSATVSITSNDATAAEDGSGPGQFTVTLTEASPTNTVIAYIITGTATATTDYTALSGTVTIIASATTATIDVSGIIDDAIVEANETVIVTLDSISSGDSGITIDDTADAATVTITDDDVATVSITATDGTAAEDGSDPGQFTVTQTAVSSTNTVIAYSITGDATPTTDYTALSGSVTITAGATTATIDVTGIIDDVFVEANETVTVTLDSISSGDSHVTVNGSANVATVTITDDDVATVSITATDGTAAEDGSDPGQFTVTQTAVSSTDTVIAYSVTGTATATTDYTALSGTVTVTAGATTATIDVSGIIDDAIVEGDETVIVTLDSISSGDSHVTINGSANVATVTITDDESSITVTAPNGSESWDLDSTESITWSDVNLTGNVKIELYKDGSLDSVLSSDEANDGTYSWVISAGLADGTDYKIRITSLVDGSVYDESDVNFELAAPASITVTDPDGSEDWETGSTHNITWSSVNLTGNVKIELYKGGSLDSTLSADEANDTTYSWDISSGLAAATDYKIRITSLVDGTVYDESDANFTLSAPASITITAPDGGESWEPDTSHDITWTSANVTGNLRIYVYKGGSYDSTISNATYNDGIYSWTVPAGLTAATDYKIKIESIDDSSVYDESDANFTISAPVSITVTAPNGSESWDLDSTESITWSDIGLTGNVKIELYKDGSLDSTLASDTANTGSYSWAIPDSLTAAVDYKIRITSLVDGTVYDESDANFTLAAPPSITVLTPDGGESWEPGTSESITWSSVSLTGTVSIELWKDGSIDSTLSADTYNDGIYSWAIDSELTEAADYKIRVTSRSDGTIYDESDANFELAEASSYDPPAVSSGLIVKLDAGDPNSFDSGDDEVWTNTVDSVEGDFLNGPVFDEVDSVKSILFDGSDDAFHIVRDNSDMDDGKFTLVSWFMPLDWTPGSESYAYIWNFGGMPLRPGFGWVVWGKMMSHGYGASGYPIYSGGDAIELDEWHMAVFVSDGAGTIDSYLNNVKAVLPDPTDHDDFDTDAPDDDFWFPKLGSYAGAGYNSEIKIAQFLIYDRALSDAEIEDLWNGDRERFGFVYQEPSVSSGLVVLLDAANPASYDPAEPTKWTNTIDDEEGTLTNGPVFESGGSVIGSLSFDGTDDFFNLTRDNSDLDSGWSLVVWINPQELTSSGTNGWFIALAKTYPYLNMGILSWPGGGLSGTRGHAASGLNPAGWVTWDDEAFAVDEWHQFVLVNQNDGTVDCFLNNVKDTGPPAGWVEDVAPGDDILAGAYSNYGTASLNLETKIAQILLYDRSLSDAEVEDLFDGDKARFGVS